LHQKKIDETDEEIMVAGSSPFYGQWLDGGSDHRYGGE
jgi:hypothetical protein